MGMLPRGNGDTAGKWGPNLRNGEPPGNGDPTSEMGALPGEWGPPLLPQTGSEISPGGPWALIYGEKLWVWAHDGRGPPPIPYNAHR